MRDVWKFLLGKLLPHTTDAPQSAMFWQNSDVGWFNFAFLVLIHQFAPRVATVLCATGHPVVAFGLPARTSVKRTAVGSSGIGWVYKKRFLANYTNPLKLSCGLRYQRSRPKKTVKKLMVGHERENDRDTASSLEVFLSSFVPKELMYTSNFWIWTVSSFTMDWLSRNSFSNFFSSCLEWDCIIFFR